MSKKKSLLKENTEATSCCCIAFLTKGGDKGVVLVGEIKTCWCVGQDGTFSNQRDSI